MKFFNNEEEDIHILVSIIVPVYNVEKYIIQSLDSIIAQTYSKLQIILVDDGSDDQSGRICDEYEKKDNRIIVIHKKNEGLVSSRKAGVERANGQYTTFVDSDDWIEPEWIETMVNLVQKTKAEIVTAGFTEFDEKGNEILVQDRIKSGLYNTDEQLAREVYSRMICYDNECKAGLTVATWDKLFKTELLRRHAGTISYDIAWGTDYVLTFPCILDATSLYISDNIHMYHYRVNDMSLTVHADRNFLFHMESLFRGMNIAFSDTNNDMLMKQVLQSKVQIMTERGVNNAYKVGNSRICRWKSLYYYNRSLIKNREMQKVFQEAHKNIEVLTEKRAKIVEALYCKCAVKAVVIEMFH